MKALLIAGGRGTRLRSLRGDSVPKALYPVDGIPIGARLLQLLSEYGVREVGVMAGYLAEELEEGLTPWARKSGLDLALFVEPKPLGTAGGLWSAREFVGESDFFVLYADLVADVDLGRLAAFHAARAALATVLCHPNDHPADSDLLRLGDGGLVREILPRDDRPPGDYRNIVPAAIYVGSPSLFDFVEKDVPQDFVRDVFPRIAAAGGLFAYNTPEYVRDMGSEKRFMLAEKDLASGFVRSLRLDRKRPAVFFDRDGVLNEEVGGQGLVRPEELRLLPGSAEAVRRVNEAGWLAICVTNQPQVAKGLLTLDGLERVHWRLDTLLGEEGAKLDRLYFCPHHPASGHPGEVPALKRDCDCRKPKTGMIEMAVSELPVDLSSSCLVGDFAWDIEAARRAGIAGYGVRTGRGCRGPKTPVRPDLMFEDALEVIRYLTESVPAIEKLAAGIVGMKPPKPGVPVFIGVSGIARSGKSCVAHGLARSLGKLGRRALHVRLDDWILPSGERPGGSNSEQRCRVERYPAILDSFARGESLLVKPYDPWTRDRSDEIEYASADCAFVILDGLWACHESIRGGLQRSFFVRQGEQTLERRFASFYAWKGDRTSLRDDLLRERRAEEWAAVARQQEWCEAVDLG